MLAYRRGWPEIAADVLEALPEGSHLRFWQYEHMSRIELRVLAEIVGVDTVSEIERCHLRPLAGPSAVGIAELERMAAEGDPLEPETVRKTLRRFSKGKGWAPFDPWTAEERAFLDQRYAEDVSLMHKLWPGASIDPD